MPPNRRQMRSARALLSSADKTLTRAAHNLVNGRSLDAQRDARTVEQLMRLDARLRDRRGFAERSAAAMHAAEQELAKRHTELERTAAELEHRQALLEAREERLVDDRARLERMRADIEALYAQIYAQDVVNDPAAGEASQS